jgi:D-xylonolactonase
MSNIEVKVLIPINCKLGEGIHWDSNRNAIWFVDILKQIVYFYSFDTSEIKRREFLEPVSWVIPIANSKEILIGLKSGVAKTNFFDINGSIEWIIKEFPGYKELRLNDAKIDKFGRLWFGSISSVDESKPVGALARFSFQKNQLEIIDTNYKVTNGPAFNFDNSIMLHNDSGNKITYKFYLDRSNGEVIKKEIWKVYNENQGYPDGMNFDAQDNVWIAHWGVGKICKYNIDGDLLDEIQFPTPNITNICFGGKELNRIFVTSAFKNFDNTNNFNPEFDGVVFEIIGSNSFGIKSHKPKL